MGKESIIVHGYLFIKDSVLKCNEISWRCSSNKKKCKAKLRTDIDVSKVTAGNMEHNHESDSPNRQESIERTGKA